MIHLPGESGSSNGRELYLSTAPTHQGIRQEQAAAIEETATVVVKQADYRLMQGFLESPASYLEASDCVRFHRAPILVIATLSQVS